VSVGSAYCYWRLGAVQWLGAPRDVMRTRPVAVGTQAEDIRSGSEAVVSFGVLNFVGKLVIFRY